MEASLICYSFGKNASKRVICERKLSGWTNYSNMGRYKYKVEGILDKIPYIKPVKSVLIVKQQDEKIIKKLFKTYGIKHRIYKVYLTPKEAKQLK